MKLLIYTVYYPSPEELGIPRDTEIVHYFARDWKRAGHDVRVVMMNFRFTRYIRSGLHRIFPKEGDYVYEGIPVHYFDVQGYLPKRWYTSSAQASWINMRLTRHFKLIDWQPDRVFIQFPTRFVGIQHPFSFGVPTFGVFHNTDRFCLQNDHGPVKRYVSQIKNLGYYNHIIRDVLRDKLGRESIPAYAGIDESLLAPKDFIEEKISNRADPLHLLYAGKFMKQKQVDTIIEAVKRLPFPCELTIVGNGTQEEETVLRRLADGIDYIHFTGRLARDRVIEQMRNADVFIMVSHTETFGLVYLESMAQGCINIGSRGEGIDGVILDSQNGYLVAPGSVEELTARLEEIYKLPSKERERLIRASYRTALETTSEKMAENELHANQ